MQSRDRRRRRPGADGTRPAIPPSTPGDHDGGVLTGVARQAPDARGSVCAPVAHTVGRAVEYSASAHHGHCISVAARHRSSRSRVALHRFSTAAAR